MWYAASVWFGSSTVVVTLPPSVHALAYSPLFQGAWFTGGARSQFMSQKLFIGGLPFSTSTEELRELFNQVDGVDNVTVVTDRDSGQSRGFGFAEMATSEAADEAIRKFNGYALGGRTLKVEVSKPSAPRGNGGAHRGGGGYRSGGTRW
jgi:hypothetical protein